MTKQNTKSASAEMQNLFNPQASQDVLRKWADTNERMAAIFVEAGTRSVDLMSKTSKEALSNLREVTQVRDEPAEYGKAYSEFAQKQMDLLKNLAQEVSELTRKTGSETSELTSEATEDMSKDVAESVEDAADKGTANAKAAADKVAAGAKDAADKAGSAAKKAS